MYKDLIFHSLCLALTKFSFSHSRKFGMRQRKWSQNNVKSSYLDKIVFFLTLNLAGKIK